MLDPNTRTAKVRCTFDNPDGLLRPEMYATVQISVEQKRALAIPRGALLRLGEYKVVFVEVGESDGRVRFERMPVDVDEGESSEWLEVKHGLMPGQKVVVSGAILLSQKL
jgi:multidrug efflux pump subunit AcrA (membrane-fusion protein)